ncbi:1094_t:CDS:2, partial [Paraglomus occultum]
MAKEFKINKETKKITDYDDKEISIEEYNSLYKQRQHPTWVRLQELYDKFSGSDIEAKRNAKKGKRKREDEKNDTPNEQPDPKKTKSDYDALKNKTLGEITNNEAATVLKESTKLEGEQGYNQDEKIESMEDKLIADDPELYRQTIIEALKERMKDLNVKKEDLDEDTKKLIEGKITDAHQVKVIKNQAVKKIGELGAKNKLTSLFSQAQALIKKAQKNVTEKIKQDIKTVQEQLK